MIVLENRKTNQFTYDYSQPDEYHFCLDSIIFAEFVASQISSGSQLRVLDLCAGCGVIGFELAYHNRTVQQIDFLEIQTLFKTHFDENLQRTKSDPSRFQFLNSDLKKLDGGNYDLIVCNPPYFDPSEGKLGLSTTKNRCHFFIDCSFAEIIGAVIRNLGSNGVGYVLTKIGDEKLLRVRSTYKPFCFELVAKVRGTNILKVSHRG